MVRASGVTDTDAEIQHDQQQSSTKISWNMLGANEPQTTNAASFLGMGALHALCRLDVINSADLLRLRSGDTGSREC